MNVMLRSESLPEGYTPLEWRRELLYFAVLGMEVPWMILWYFIVQPGANKLPALITVGFVLANLVVAVSIVRIMIHRNLPDSLLRWVILAGAGFGVVFALIALYPPGGIGGDKPFLAQAVYWLPLPPYPVITGALVVGLWVRALQIAGDMITPVRTSFGFRLGILMMIVAAAIGDTRIRNAAVAMLPLFFFAGLLATSLARLASLRVNRTVQRASFSTRWIGFSGLIAAVISSLGFVVALLLAGVGLTGISQVIQGIFAAAAVILLALIAPLLQILESIVSALSEAIANAVSGAKLPPLGTGQANLKIDPQTLAANANRVALISTGINVALVVVLIALGVFILLRLLRRRDVDRMVEGEEREGMDSDGLLHSLGNALRDGLMGLQGLADLFGQRRLLNVLTIRRLYARLILRAAALGYPRGATETPFEYQHQLQVAFPGFPGEIALVTQAYVNAHYGESLDGPDVLATVKAAVEAMLTDSEQHLNK